MLNQIIVFFLTFCFLLLATNSHALELQSPRFKLDVENIGIDVKKNTTVYTLQSLYGNRALKNFQSSGHFIKSYRSGEGLTFSLSPSMLSFTDITSGQNVREQMVFSLGAPNELDYHVNLIQEYPLKNISGETIALDYSLDNSNFRPLPNQNKGDLPATITSKNGQKTSHSHKISFKLNPSAYQPEGTYETIIDFIAVPSY